MIKKLILIICLTFWPNLILANTEYFEQGLNLFKKINLMRQNLNLNRI